MPKRFASRRVPDVAARRSEGPFRDHQRVQRPWRRVVRLVRYWLALVVVTLGLGYSMMAAWGGDAPSLAGRSPGREVSVLSTLLVSPLVETLLMFWCWKALRAALADTGKLYAAFVTVVVGAAWLLHGANVLALLPAAMFLFGAVFAARSIDTYGWSPAQGFGGAAALHVLYNLPSVALR